MDEIREAVERRPEGDLGFMARALAWLFVVGATLALLTILLPHGDGGEDVGVLVVLLDAYVVGALLFWQAGRVPTWGLATLLAFGTVHISLVSYFSHARPSPLIFFYLWIFLYSAYFFTRRVLAGQILFVGVNFGLVLALREPESAAEAWWIVGMGSMLVVAVLVTSMRERAGRLIDNLDATARERERAKVELQLHRDNLEQLVSERTAALSVAYRELESFSYSVSHDLRAPLRGLDGFSQALVEDYGDQLDGEAQDYLARIRAASQRMSQLIDDLLQLSRLARSEMHRERVDLTAIAVDIAAELQAAEPERNVEVMLADEVVAEADISLVRVVLHNLIGNAWKFTGRRPEATIEFGILEIDSESVCFVRDDGVGFDMKYADKLFGAFQRLHSSSEFEGTGIGLATVQRAVSRHGGRVWADSAPGDGATFFTLAGRDGTALT